MYNTYPVGECLHNSLTTALITIFQWTRFHCQPSTIFNTARLMLCDQPQLSDSINSVHCVAYGVLLQVYAYMRHFKYRVSYMVWLLNSMVDQRLARLQAKYEDALISTTV